MRRRYQDFLWLKGRLEEAHPTIIVHTLPEKFVMKGIVERPRPRLLMLPTQSGDAGGVRGDRSAASVEVFELG